MIYPHVPAAFINAIAEEGTKAEAIEYLQRQWNETCALRAALEKIARSNTAYGIISRNALGGQSAIAARSANRDNAAPLANPATRPYPSSE